MKKGRAAPEKCVTAEKQQTIVRHRLSPEAKQEIAARCAAEEKQVDAARLYGVTESCVSKIIRKSRSEGEAAGGSDAEVTRVGRPPKARPR